MFFNPEIFKQAQEFIFFIKNHNFPHFLFLFKNVPAVCTSSQKTFGFYQGEKLNNDETFNERFSKLNNASSLVKDLT